MRDEIKKATKEVTSLQDGSTLLDIAKIFDPFIALLMCAIWNDYLHLGKHLKVFVQLALSLILLLSLLIPVGILLENR